MNNCFPKILVAIFMVLGLCLSGVVHAADTPEDIFWNSVRKGNVAEEYEAYLTQYPKGRYEAEARSHIEGLDKVENEFWRLANETSDHIAMAGYLDRFPEGRYASEARNIITELNNIEVASRLGRTIKDCAECPELIIIPEGTFDMGSNISESGPTISEGPIHQVTMTRKFALAKYETTVAEFRYFIKDTHYRTDAELDSGKQEGCNTFRVGALSSKVLWSKGDYWESLGFAQSDLHPVACISWNDAQAYIKWLKEKTGKKYRLPSEAEWEYAARAGTTSTYYWGDDEIKSCSYANVSDSTWGPFFLAAWSNALGCSDGYFFAAPVGSFLPNAFGLYDMIGNVAEWVEDCWNADYGNAPEDGSVLRIGKCDKHPIRGGAWGHESKLFRSAARIWAGSLYRSSYIGIRLARTLP